MLTLYYVFIGIGTCILLLSLIGGDILDMDIDTDMDMNVDGVTDSTSVFSLRTISAGFLSFGTGALMMNHNGYGLTLQILVGCLTGGLVVYLVYLLTKALYSFQGDSNTSLASLVGKSGIITIGTSPSGNAQLKVDTNNGPKEYTCKETTSTLLRQSDIVKITDKIGNLLIVSK
jgi:membrane protein implicated in regulation of membrane protease activity